MRLSTVLGAGLAALTMGAATTGSSAVSDPPVRAGRSVVIGTFNMAGGHPELSQHRSEAPEALVGSINSRGGRVAFVAMQEVCRDWAEYLDARLPGYTVRFDPVWTGRMPGRCMYPNFGNALLYRDDLGIGSGPVGHSLGTPAGMEQREMVCASSRARRLVLCSAHLTYDNAGVRHAEAATAGRILENTYAGYTKLLGVDLNDDPLSDTASSLYGRTYARDARGAFKEAASPCGNVMREKAGGLPSDPYCRSGEPTRRAGSVAWKLDYLFVTPRVPLRGAGTSRADYSDHSPLWAEVTL